MMILVYAIKILSSWFFIEWQGCKSIGVIQNWGIGKLLEGGGVEAWTVEMLRFGRWRCWGFEGGGVEAWKVEVLRLGRWRFWGLEGGGVEATFLNIFSWLTPSPHSFVFVLVFVSLVFIFYFKLKEMGLQPL